MTTNPYESPGASSFAEGSSKSEKWDIELVVFLSVAALVEAASGVFAWKSGVSTSYSNIIFLVTPAFALLFSGGYAIRRFGSVSLRSSLSQLVSVTCMTVLIAVCGYVCFGMSCSFINTAAGFSRYPAPEPSSSPANLGFGIVSAVTMVLSCLSVVGILRAVQKKPAAKSDMKDG